MKKKKLLCTVFMAALAFATTNTFVSCKDYDDDISDLRTEIGKLATADELSSKVSEMQNAIRDAQNAAEQKATAAQQVADAAKAAATDAASAAAAAQAKADELEKSGATKAEVDAAKEAADAAQAAADKAASDANAAIAQVKDDLEAAAAAAAEAVRTAQATADQAKADVEEAKKNLKAIENSSATKAEVEAVKVSVTTAQAAADKAQADVVAAQAAADKAAQDAAAVKTTADAAVAAITAVENNVSTMQTNLTSINTQLTTINTLLEEAGINIEGTTVNVAGLSTRIDGLNDALNALGVKVSAMITDIQLYDTHALAQVAGELFDNTLDFIQTQELRSGEIGLEAWKNTASDATVDKKITFTGETYIGEDSILVRVSPADAELNADNISLINSQGVEISKEVVEVSGVQRYNRLMTRAAGSNTGLWVVKFKANDVADAFYEKAIDKSLGYERRIVYAVAVKNDEVANDNRRVTSEFALDLNTEVAEHGWDFAVNDVDINKIRNRYVSSDIQNVITDDKLGTPRTYQEELVWLDVYRPAVDAITDGASKNAADRFGHTVGSYIDGKDNRNAEKILGVEVGKPIKIKFDVDAGSHQYAKVKGFYVTLDDRFALESNPSEYNAWASYVYQNVGYKKYLADENNREEIIPAHLFEGSEGEILIKDLMNVAGDVIGFRVYAVNYDGTLVDPDGRAFYVAVGQVKSEETIATANAEYQDLDGVLAFNTGELIPTEAFDIEFDGVKTAQDYDLPNGKYAYSKGWINITPDKDDKIKNFRVMFYDKNKKYIGDDASALSYDDNTGKSNVGYVRFVLENPGTYVDGDTYAQSITLQKYTNPTDKIGAYDVRTINISVTKVMPEGPEFTYLAGQDKYQWLAPVINTNITTRLSYKVNQNGTIKNGAINLENVLIGQNNLYAGGSSDLMTSNVGEFVFEIENGTYVETASGWVPGIAKVLIDYDPNTMDYDYPLFVKNNVVDDTHAPLIDNTTERMITGQYKFYGISKRIVTTTPASGFQENLAWIVASPSEKEIVYCSWTKGFTTSWKSSPYIVNWSTTGNVVTVDLDNAKWEWYSETRLPSNVQASLAPNPTTMSLKDLLIGNYLNVVATDDIPANITTNVWTESESQINPYFTAEFDNGNIILTQKNQGVQPTLKHTETIHFSAKDCFGNVISIELPITVQP